MLDVRLFTRVNVFFLIFALSAPVRANVLTSIKAVERNPEPINSIPGYGILNAACNAVINPSEEPMIKSAPSCIDHKRPM